MIVDLDPKAKALEDYEAATNSLLKIFNQEGLIKQPENGQSVAV
jgi:hypothetical protein